MEVGPDRLERLQRIWGPFEDYCARQGTLDPQRWRKALLDWWIPLAERIEQQQRQAGRCWIQGISSPPGAGKSTLAQVLSLILEDAGVQAEAISLDDFYLPFSEQRELARRAPSLPRRGPPGTHDVDRAIEALQALREGREARIPVYDKSCRGGRGDRTGHRTAKGAQVALFEGWFIGAVPQSPVLILATLAAQSQDQRRLALEANGRLDAYLLLWACLDALLVLSVADQDWVRRWRTEAEEHRRRLRGEGMSEDEARVYADYLLSSLPHALFHEVLANRTGPSDIVVPIGSDRFPLDAGPELSIGKKP